MYSFKGKDIPIFEIYTKELDKEILILNESRLGLLTQHSPIDQGESEKLKQDIFYMNIQSFSEDSSLIDEFIRKPPEWLQKISDTEKRKNYLRERVLIHIFERLEFIKHKDFEGYKLKVTDPLGTE
jgi:hypothetical protein